MNELQDVFVKNDEKGIAMLRGGMNRLLLKFE